MAAKADGVIRAHGFELPGQRAQLATITATLLRRQPCRIQVLLAMWRGRYTNSIGVSNQPLNAQAAIPLELSIAGFSLPATIASTRNVVSQYLIHHTKQAGRTKVGSKIRETTIAQEFAAIRDEAGITGSNPPTLHEIRSLSARLYKEKYGEEFAQALLGHKSEKMAALYQDQRDGWFRPKIAK